MMTSPIGKKVPFRSLGPKGTGSLLSSKRKIFPGPPRPSFYGFTLLEILLVVIVIGVVAAVSLPNFSQSYGRLLLKTTADQLAYLMRYAQNRAVSRQRVQQLQFGKERLTYRLLEDTLKDSSVGEKTFGAIAGRMGRAVDIPHRITMAASLPKINFFEDGTMDKIRIRLCHKKQCLMISTQEQRGYIHVIPEEVLDAPL